MGEAVLKYDKYCRGSKDYLSLGREILTDDKVLLKDEREQKVKAPRPAVVVAQEQVVEETIHEAENEPVEEVIAKAVAEAMEETKEYQPSERMQEIVTKEAAAFVGSALFKLNAPSAQSVFVTGSFNDWSLDESCRMKNIGGVWTLQLPLKPGMYKYQFIVDGKWQEDPENKLTERNSFGDINSLVEVQG
jgi:hypothetical protein